MVDRQSLPETLAYLRAAHVDKSGAQDRHPLRHGSGVDGIALAGIDRHLIVGENFLMRIPAVELRPVVAPDEEHKLTVGEVAGERLQRVPGIGRFGQVKLIVAGYQTIDALDGGTHQTEPFVVVEHIDAHLPWILRGDHQPHLIEMCRTQQFLCQMHMAVMHRIERTAENTGPHTSSSCENPKASLTARNTSALATSRSSLTTMQSKRSAKVSS